MTYILPAHVVKSLADAYNALYTGERIALPEVNIEGKTFASSQEIADEVGIPLQVVQVALEEKTRYVRTPAGARRFGQPIGTPIAWDAPGGGGDRPLFSRRWHLLPRGAHTFSRYANAFRGGGMGGGGFDGGGGGFGGGGFSGFSGFGSLSAFDAAGKGKSALPGGARKVAQAIGGVLRGAHGKAERYLEELPNGAKITWLVLSVYDSKGKLKKQQAGKLRPGLADQQWLSISRALRKAQ